MTVKELLEKNADIGLDVHISIENKYICYFKTHYQNNKYEKIKDCKVVKWGVSDYNEIHIEIEPDEY